MPAFLKFPSVCLLAAAIVLHALSTFPTKDGLTLFGIAAGASVAALVLAKRGW